jgi:hypothetical protein
MTFSLLLPQILHLTIIQLLPTSRGTLQSREVGSSELSHQRLGSEEGRVSWAIDK